MAARKDRKRPRKSRSSPHGQGEWLQIPPLIFARFKFRTKVLLAYIIFVALAILAQAVFFLRPEEARLERAQEDNLAIQARQFAVVTPTGPGGPRWTQALRTLAGIAGVRLTLIAADGKVIGDSESDASSMENHAGRPEVKQALAGRVGHSRRFSRTLHADLLYTAIPLRKNGRIVGVVRVAKPQREVQTSLAKLRATFAIGALVAAVLALFIIFLLTSRMARPLQALEKAARQLGSGDFHARVREFGQDELGVMARTFNRMAKQIEQLVANLAQEKGKVLTILATMADGVIVFDQNQRVILANRAAGEFLGNEPEKMTGHTPAEILLPPAAISLIAEAVKNRANANGEFELHLPARRPIAAALTPIRDSDLHLFGTLMVMRDMSALRHLERVRRDFVANVSHELKTPLASIKIMIETLLEGGLADGEQRNFLTAVDTECDRLNALVDDLLTLAKLDNGAAKPRSEVFPLDALIVETAGRLFPENAARRPQIALSPELPPAKADPDRIRQILINLLDNAVKYSPPEAAFGVRASCDAAWITVTVWDEGPGIPEEERERIFERFYRLDKARSRALGGTGLGLSIVKHLVEGYGGRIWVENRVGAEFSFTVPRAKLGDPGDALRTGANLTKGP